MSFDSLEIDSNYGEATPENLRPSINSIEKKKTGKFVPKTVNLDFFEDAKIDDSADYVVNPNDVNLSLNNNSYAYMKERGNNGFESSNEDSASSGANHS
jgi:hypothetical protein